MFQNNNSGGLSRLNLSRDGYGQVLYKRSELMWDSKTGEILTSSMTDSKNQPTVIKANNCEIMTTPRGRAISPDMTCMCGSYGYEFEDDANLHCSGSVMIKIVISGRAFAYGKSTHFEHHQLRKVFTSRCNVKGCSNCSDRLALVRNNKKDDPSLKNSLFNLIPICKNHSVKFHPNYQMSFEEFSQIASKTLAFGHDKITITPTDPALKQWISNEGTNRIGKSPGFFSMLKYRFK